MIIAIHQPNFCPWMPFFSKMDQCDIFVILSNVQFEKNGWQNRCQVNNRYWTNPVKKGMDPITDKFYTTGHNLLQTNMYWIKSVAMTLDIDTSKIKYDYTTELKGTNRLIDICKHYGGTHYLTNPDAEGKYLEKDLMLSNGIEIIPHNTTFKLHVFEAFDRWGIQRTRELLKKETARARSSTIFQLHE